MVSKRPPTSPELKALDFAWKVCKHVKSNAIVYAKENQLIGVGAGQMSRVDSSKIAAFKEAGIGVAATPSEMADTLLKMM